MRWCWPLVRWLVWSRWFGARLGFETWCAFCCWLGHHDWYPVYVDADRRPVVVECYWCGGQRQVRSWDGRRL